MSTTSLPRRVTLVEVGPRDGLQNEKEPVSTAAKIALIDALQDAGVREIEATSFVSPKWVPQMADAADVMAGIERRAGVRYSVLTPNLKGWEAAHATRPDEIVVFGAASEAFSLANINCSIAESMARFAPVVAAARAAGVKVRGAISCALGCPYEGPVAPEAVGRVARLMKEIGVQHVGVADTIGVGTPLQVRAAMLAALEHFPLDEVSGHFHDTYGMALANVFECLQLGVHVFDASVSGLGGCPYAKGATGNVATEDVVYLLHGLGIETGIDLGKLIDAGQAMRDVIGKPNGSRVARALLAKRNAEAASLAATDREAVSDPGRPEGFRRVEQALRRLGHAHEPRFLEVAARTSQEAADALGVSVGQIAKSVVFRRKADDVAVMVVTSGDRRVDERKVAGLVGAIGRADAEFVKSRTGFTIGGVSPVALAAPVVVLIDRELFRFDAVWAAAGHPNGVFSMTPAELVRLTGAPVHDVTP
jgi:hydroxymethylglutaryl-CoA lyase